MSGFEGRGRSRASAALRLLSTTALASVSATALPILVAAPAMAACVAYGPTGVLTSYADGMTVECKGPDTDGIKAAAFENVIILIQKGSSVVASVVTIPGGITPKIGAISVGTNATIFNAGEIATTGAAIRQPFQDRNLVVYNLPGATIRGGDAAIMSGAIVIEILSGFMAFMNGAEIHNEGTIDGWTIGNKIYNSSGAVMDGGIVLVGGSTDSGRDRSIVLDNSGTIRGNAVRPAIEVGEFKFGVSILNRKGGLIEGRIEFGINDAGYITKINNEGTINGVIYPSTNGDVINSGTINGDVIGGEGARIYSYGPINGTVELARHGRLVLGDLAPGYSNHGALNIILGPNFSRVTLTGGGTKVFDAKVTVPASGALVKDGWGTWILAGTPTGSFFDQIVVNEGVLKLGADGLLKANTALVVNSVFDTDGRALVIDRLINRGAVSGGGTITATGGFTVEGTTGSRIDAVLAGGGLTVAGDATLMRPNTYTGGTSISGTLRLEADGALPTGSSVFLNGGTLALGKTRQSVGNLAGIGGSVDLGTGTLTTTGAGLFSGGLTGSGTFVKEGTGTLTLTGTNTQTGETIIRQGVLAAGSSGALSAAGAYTIQSGARLRLPANQSVGSIAGSGTIDFLGGANLTVGANGASSIFSGNLAGTGTLTKAGLGTLTLRGPGTGTLGRMVVQRGTLRGDAESLSALITVNDHLNFDQATDATYAGAIGGFGRLSKTGAGALTLSGNHSYSGRTTVSNGMLRANGTFASDVLAQGNGRFVANGIMAGSDIEVRSGGSLAGGGRVGHVRVDDGNLAAGDGGIGTLTVASLALSSASFLSFELGAAGDQIAVGGNLVLDGTLNLLSRAGFDPSAPYRLFALSGGTLTDRGLNIGLLPEGLLRSDVVLTNSASGVDLTFASAPVVQNWQGAAGGSGVWDATATNWTNASNGAAASWARRAAAFGGTGGIVTVSGNQSFGHLSFLSNGYSVVGATGADTLTPDGMAGVNVAAGVTASVGASLTGAGGIAKTGSGTLVLSGANTYSGGTQVLEGVLRGSTSSLQGAIFNNAAVVFSQIANGTYAGVMSGSGSLAKEGAGTVTLTGANTYAGGTFLRGGVLAVGSDAALGAETGGLTFSGGSLRALGNLSSSRDITLAGSGIIDTGGFDAAFSGDIAGSGLLTKTGAGTLTLTGASTADGGIAVQAGTLVGSTLSLGTGPIANNGNLVFDQGWSGTFDAPISGAGNLVKRGAGTLTLGGTHTYTGDTTVSGGALLVDGSIASSRLTTVSSGATLGGSGTVGDTAVFGTLAPGSGVGSITVNGNLVFGAGASFAVDANAVAADRATITGAAVLTGGRVHLEAERFTYRPNASYTILTAAGGLGGTEFAGVSSTFAFLAPSLSYSGTDVTLALSRNETTVQSVARTANQQAVATAVNGLPADNALLLAVLGLTTDEVPGALDQVSGEAHASAAGLAASQASTMEGVVLSRMRRAAPRLPSLAALSGTPTSFAAGHAVATALDRAPRSDYVLWGEALGGWGRTAGSSNTAGFTRSTGGLVAGAELGWGTPYRLGIAGSYQSTSFEAPGRLSSGEVTGGQLALYGSAAFGAFSVRGGAAFGHHAVELSRSASFRGFSGTVQASSSVGSAQGFIEAGYRFDLGALQVEPFAGLSHLQIAGHSFTEKGASSMALAGTVRGFDVTTSTMGVRLAATLPVWDGRLTAHGTLAWRHAFAETVPQAEMRFTAGSVPFAIEGAPIARDSLALEAGLDFALSDAVTMSVKYDGQLARNARDHAIKGGLNVRF